MLTQSEAVQVVVTAVREVFGDDHPCALRGEFFYVKGDTSNDADWDRLIVVHGKLLDIDDGTLPHVALSPDPAAEAT